MNNLMVFPIFFATKVIDHVAYAINKLGCRVASDDMELLLGSEVKTVTTEYLKEMKSRGYKVKKWRNH